MQYHLRLRHQLQRPYAHIYNALIGSKQMKEIIRKTQVPFLDIAPAHPDLIGAEVEIDMEDREFVLKRALNDLREDLRLYIHRLSSVAGAPHHQCPCRLRPVTYPFSASTSPLKA